MSHTASGGKHPAIFLDRDGTLILEKHYLHRPEEVELIPRTGEALKRLTEAGYLLFIVTNQSGVGRGYFTMQDVQAVNFRMMELLAAFQIDFRKIYIAPERPDEVSKYRKPSPQALLDSVEEFGVDLCGSYMIGDRESDLECGKKAGARAILVLTGYGKSIHEKGLAEGLADFVAADLFEAAHWILNSEPIKTN